MALTQVSTGGVKDGTLLNADVNSNAAIAGTKIADSSITGSKLVNDTITAVQLANGAADVNVVLDGAIVNSKVNANAAIAGTKISPNFGSQNIATTGNVGIGTSSPNYELQVNDSSSAVSVLQLTNTTTGSGAGDGLLVYNNGLNALISNEEAGDLRLQTSGLQRLTIDSSGNVGIGATSPSATVHILNDDPQLRLQRSGSHSTSAGPLIQFQGRGPNTVNYNFAKIQAVSSGSNNAGELQFFTNTGGNQDERMRIASDGTIKLNGTDNTIHTNSDAAKIAIFGGSTNSVSHGGVVTMTGVNHSAGCFTDLAAGTGGHLQFRIGTSHAMRIDSSGKVGIGTQTPAQKLHISNSFGTPTGGIDSNIALLLSHTSAGNSVGYGMLSATNGVCFMHFGDTGNADQGAIVYNNNDDSLSFNANGTTRLTISSSGNIGAPSGTNIYNASDSRLKKNVVDLSKGLDVIKSLRPISFNWIDGFCDEEKETLYGFIAQEIEKIDKNLVEKFGSGTVTIGEQVIDDVVRVKEKSIIPLLVKSIQELEAKVAALKAG